MKAYQLECRVLSSATEHHHDIGLRQVIEPGAKPRALHGVDEVGRQRRAESERHQHEGKRRRDRNTPATFGYGVGERCGKTKEHQPERLQPWDDRLQDLT